jgi:hypothetical protein
MLGAGHPGFGKIGFGCALVAYLEGNLRAVLATLEECRASLVSNGDSDTAQLVSVAILELRIKLNRIEDSELKALCEAILREEGPTARPVDSKPLEGVRQRPPVSLKLVK